MMNTKENKDSRRVDDWTSIDGATAEIVQEGQTVARGRIDGVTDDGGIVWIQDDTGQRKLYERSEAFQVWVPREHTGLNYKVSRSAVVLPMNILDGPTAHA